MSAFSPFGCGQNPTSKFARLAFEFLSRNKLISTLFRLQGWHHTSSEGAFGGRNGVMSSSKRIYNITPAHSTLAYITIIQPKKRSNTDSRYWYIDPCLIVLKRVCNSDDWTYVDCIVTGIRRQVTIEVFIEAAFQYCCVPFSCFAAQNRQQFPFRLVCYSGESVIIDSVLNSDMRAPALDSFYRKMLSCENRICYPVAMGSILACIHGDGCAIFLAVNAALDHYLSIKLSIQLPQDGMVISLGAENESYDIPPRSQSALVIVSSDGKLSGATQLSFSYMGSIVKVDGSKKKRDRGANDLGIPFDLTLAGDLVVKRDYGPVNVQGKDTIDTFLWIPQLGAS